MEEMQPSRGQRFAAWVLQQRCNDIGFAAKLRRGDNPDTEYYALGLLSAFGVDIQKDAERLPFALIGAALCRSHSETDGDRSLGTALLHCDVVRGLFGEDNPHLRRILACDNVPEICRVLRPVLSLLDASGSRLCLGRLLDDLLLFNKDAQRQRVRLRWAGDYFRINASDNIIEGDETCAG